VSRPTGLTHSLIDDAAVFPPGNASLPDALVAHQAFRDSRYESVVGPLLVPASGVEKLRLLADPETFTSIALVADTGFDGLVAARDAVQDDAWLDLVHVELRLTVSNDPAQDLHDLLVALPFTVPVYIELPQDINVDDPLSVLAADGVERAKFRCGPVQVPTATVLGQFLYSATALRVPFKLTAGLHHALPHDATNGVTQHGFVNTLAATWAAMDGADLATVSSLLETRDPDIVLSVLDAANVSELRGLYRSFGSCSITEPYDELATLNLIAEDL
jgi:hypothetical protein